MSVVGIQYPGRTSRRNESWKNLDVKQTSYEICNEIGEYVKKHNIQRYLLFGHSFGAALAYETTLAIENSTFLPPSLLILSGRRAPHSPQIQTWALDDLSLFQVLCECGGISQQQRQVLINQTTHLHRILHITRIVCLSLNSLLQSNFTYRIST
jgi:surfactin synthase thioesterase subunit